MTHLDKWLPLNGMPSRLEIHVRGSEANQCVRRLYMPALNTRRVALRLSLLTSPALIAKRPKDWVERVAHAVDGALPEASSAALMKSATADRFLAVLKTPDGLRFAKIAGVNSRSQLEGEANWLRRLAGHIGETKTPRLVRWAVQDEFAILVTDVAEPHERPYCAKADDALKIACTLASCNEPIVHGDLTEWNILGSSGNGTIIDWEAATLDFVPGLDLTHFLVQSGALLRRFSASQAADLLVGSGGIWHTYLVQSGLGDLGPRQLLDAIDALPFAQYSQSNTRFASDLRAHVAV